MVIDVEYIEYVREGSAGNQQKCRIVVTGLTPNSKVYPRSILLPSSSSDANGLSFETDPTDDGGLITVDSTGKIEVTLEVRAGTIQYDWYQVGITGYWWLQITDHTYFELLFFSDRNASRSRVVLAAFPSNLPDPVLSIRDLIIARNGKYRIRGSAQHIVSGQRLRVIFLTHGTGGNVVSNFFIPFTETGDHDFQFTGDIPRSGTLAALLGGTPKSYTNVSMYVVAADATSELSNLYFDNTVHPLTHGTIPKPVINITEFTVTTAGKYRVRGIVNNVLSGERLRIIVGTRGSAGTLVVFNFFVPFTKKFDYEFAFDGDLPRGNRTLTDIFGTISTSYYTNVSLYVVSATGTTELSNLYFDNTQHSLHTAFPEIQITTLQGNPFVRVNVPGSTNRFASGTTSTTLDIEFGNIPSEYCDIELTATKIAGAGTVTNPNRTYPIANHSPNGTISLTINNSGDLAYSVAVNLKARNADQNSADVWCSDAIDVVIGTTNIANLRNDHLMQISSPKMWRQIEHNGETVNLEYALKDLTTGKPSTTLGPAVYALQVVLPSNNVYPVDFKGFLPTATTIDTAFLGKRIINANSRSRFLGNGHNLQDLPAGDYLILLRMATNTQLEGQGDLTLTNPNIRFNANRRWKAVPVPNGFNSVTYGQAGIMLRVLPTTKPTITISGLINGQQINRLQAAAVNVSATSVSADNVAIIPVWSDITDPENPKAAVLMNLQNLAAGNYVYEVSATDVNNEKTTRVIQFSVVADTTKPVLRIINPIANNVYLHDSKNITTAGSRPSTSVRNVGTVIPISATATDDRDGDITDNIVFQDITDPENPISIPANILADLTQFSAGRHAIRATVTDRNGNTSTQDVAFVISDPVLTWAIDQISLNTTANLPVTWDLMNGINTGYLLIWEPNETPSIGPSHTGQTTLTERITTVKGSGTAFLFRAGIDQEGVYTAWSFTTRSGAQVGSVDGTIQSGITLRTNPTVHTFQLGDLPDTTKPVITITSPANNAMIEKAGTKTDIVFTATDDVDGDVSGSVTTMNVTDSNNPVIASRNNLQNLALGTYTYQLNVTDDAGNVADPKSITFTIIDTTKPVITITSPMNGQQIRTNQAFDLTATAIDSVDGDLTSMLTWQDITDPKKPTDITKTTGIVLGNNPGTYTYRASVTDKSNNESMQDVTFSISRRRDTTNPVIVIIGPLNGSRIPHVPVVLIASATDDRDGDISSSVTWQDITDPENPISITSPANFSIGTHTVRASVTDQAGNTATATSSFMITDQAGPVITITSPTEKEYERNVPINLTATAIDRIDGDISNTIEWTDLDTGESLTSPATFQQIRDHRIEARSVDSIGNISSKVVTISIIHFYEKPHRRIRFIREIGGLPRTITDGEILQRIITDDFIANDLFVGRIDRNSNDQDYHNLITVSNIITAIQLMITINYTDSDARNGRDNSVRTLTSLYQEIVASTLQSSELQRSTVAINIKETPNEGTFD